MIVSMNVSHFVKICPVLTILHQLICGGVANFGTRCSILRPVSLLITLFVRAVRDYGDRPAVSSGTQQSWLVE